MLAKLNSCTLAGIDALPVEVEVDASAGLPKTILVGLAETAVKEAIHRVERSLDGNVRPVKGALAMAAHKQKLPRMLVPMANAREAAVVEGLDIFGVSSLSEAVGILTGQLPVEPIVSNIDDLFFKLSNYEIDFGEVRGQEFAKRALVVAAAGGVYVQTS